MQWFDSSNRLQRWFCSLTFITTTAKFSLRVLRSHCCCCIEKHYFTTDCFKVTRLSSKRDTWKRFFSNFFCQGIIQKCQKMWSLTSWNKLLALVEQMPPVFRFLLVMQCIFSDVGFDSAFVKIGWKFPLPVPETRLKTIPHFWVLCVVTLTHGHKPRYFTSPGRVAQLDSASDF